ncbi:MAG TPA: GNAT family N-acetyltransferase, partial [candidate division Zixibacteria bacterium]|nr:GNAT family N-acetyltransferase [candidate division Zixibacteria bacterium]
MDEKYQIVYVEKPEESAWGIIGRGVGSYNTQQAGDNQFQRLCFALHGSDSEIVGGVLGEVYWGWFYVDLLWVKEDLRGQGYGHRLLAMAEDEARKRGAKNAYLDTFSFQAPEFYKDHGYHVFG